MAERADRLPWEDRPFVNHEAATQRAIRAAQSPRTDPNSPGVVSYARRAFDLETAKVRNAASGTRNGELFKASAALFELVAAGALNEADVVNALRDGCRANGLETEDGEGAVVATIRSGRRRGLDNPRDLSHVGTGSNGIRLEDELLQSVRIDTVIDIERGFWTQRESLQHIYIGALARMCSPWAVLGYCAARALALVRPSTRLPPLIGGPGSLNWFCAIAANSAGGKTSSASVAMELVEEFVLYRNLGSGEGMIDQYVKPANKETGEPQGLHESVMFMVDEIDNMSALGSRSGTTLTSVLRSGFSGQTLGFSNRTSSNLHLEAQSYRMTMVVNAQAARAGALMDDKHGGTLQRFMWFPANDPRITAEIPLMPGALRLPSPSAWLYPRELAVPYEAIELIRDEHVRRNRGEGNTLDGHALFVREKFAYALAVLDGRDQMSSEDWRLAGIASRVSDHTRNWVATQLDQAVEDEASERGRLQGVSAVAADEEKSFRAAQRLSRIGRWAMDKLANHKHHSQADLNRLLTSRDRPYLPAVLESLQRSGLIELDDQKRWTRADG